MAGETSEEGWVLSDQALAKVVKAVRRLLGESHSKRDDRRVVTSGPVNWRPYINDAGETVPSYGVVRLSTSFTVVTDPNTSSIIDVVYHALKPSTDWTRRYGVNSASPTTDGGTGLLCLEGPCIVACDATAAQGEGWGPKKDQFTLAKNYPETTHIDGMVDVGNKWAYGSFGIINSIVGKLDAASTKGTTGVDVSVWAGTPGNEVDTGWDVSTVDWMLDNDSTIASGKKIFFQFANGIPYQVSAECAT